MKTLFLTLTDSAKYDAILNIGAINMTGNGKYDGRDLGESSIIPLQATSDMVEWLAYLRVHQEAAAELSRTQYARLIKFARQRTADVANQHGDNPDDMRRMFSIHYLNLMSVGHNDGIRARICESAASSTVGASEGRRLDTTLPSVMRQYGNAASRLADQLSDFDNQ